MRAKTASTHPGRTAENQPTSSGPGAREHRPDPAPEREPHATAQVIYLHGDGAQHRTQHPTRVAAAAADACDTTAPELRARRPKQTQTTVPDCRSLVLVTYPSGRATWFFDFRHPVTGLRSKVRMGPANDKSGRPGDRGRAPSSGGRGVVPLSTNDAVIKATAMREALARGVVPVEIDLTFGEFVVGLYADACRRTGKRSLADDLSRARKHLLPLLSDQVLRGIHKRQLVALLDRLSEAGMSAATRNRIAALLRAIYRTAQDLGLVEASPAVDLPWLPENPPEPKSFPLDELSRLGVELKVASELLQVFAGIAATTAMRSGEVQNLKWEDIDFEAGEILLPVTKSGRPQKVPLTPAVRAYLDVAAGWRRDGNPYVFPRPRGRTPLPVPRKEWHETLARASLPKQGFHVLRKTWATQAAYAGVPVITISRALRHAAVSTTERHYLATRRDEQHAAANQVGDLFRAALGA
ncbi:tyrosine-type recombinase/integrase [Roseateles puraquae]|uniref:tyrosine-type recombinase/integrase n=1 Tax=Roseateles puraquae TaxID=431059 RepID=UPI0031D1840C